VALAARITPVETNRFEDGVPVTGGFPVDDPTNPPLRTPTKANQYYNWDTTPGQAVVGGDPTWKPLIKDVEPPLVDQRNLRYVQVLFEVTGNAGEVPTVCTWDIYNMHQINDAAGIPARDGGTGGADENYFMAMGKFKTARYIGDRPGRIVYVVDETDATKWVKAPYEFPAPVFKRASGPRVVVDLPVPNLDQNVFNFLFDLVVPGGGVPTVSMAFSVNTDGVVSTAAAADEPDSGGEGTTFEAPTFNVVMDTDISDQIPGADTAANITDLRALGYSGPAFTVGQYVSASNGREYHWDGSDWKTGVAP
jgi:hypothetical protein